MNGAKVKVIGMVLAAVLMAYVPGFNVMAAEATTESDVEVLHGELMNDIPETYYSVNENLRATTFTNAEIIAGFSSNGMLIEFITSTSKNASTIGVKNIVIQKKEWYGWKTVATAEGGGETDSSLTGYQVLYKGAEKGATYRVTCTHYANVDGYRELNATSGELVCDY